MSKKKITLIGPGALIAAAFIGPGTVTVCTLAGVNYGVEILWVVVLSVALTTLFQYMSAKVGVVTGKDLTQLLRLEINNPLIKALASTAVVSAIVIGNAAYEAGNISGGALGLDTFIVPKSGNIYPIIIGGLAFVFLWFGNQKILETGLTILIALMSLAFVYTAFNAFIDWESIVSGLFIPTIPDGSLLTILALLGTTIVPYNLFLHASLAKTKWKGPNDLAQMKRDTMLSILIGGAISMSIVIAASAVQGEPIRSAIDLANGLEPTFGSLAQSFVSIGLFAAGLTSAITAPLAAAYVLSGIWGKSTDRKSSFFRSTWMIILGIGILFSTIGFKPILLIQFAQVANGLVLPFIALFLIWVSSQKSILGTYINHRWMNITGIVAMVFVIVIGLKGIWGVIA